MSKEHEEKIIVITGQPANGKTTVGRILHDTMDFTYIEGDDFVTPLGKKRLNNGTWDDTDRRIYISRMAAQAVEAQRDNPLVVIVDCLTTRWMREFLVDQITAINNDLAVGFILIERELSEVQVEEIAAKRSAAGHALDIEALQRFRHAFEPWDPRLTHIELNNPGDGNLEKLALLTKDAILQIWNH
ncbi:MAG: AAA family ATPase [Patescibacteria group bacterium]|jgi:gluconate kinase